MTITTAERWAIAAAIAAAMIGSRAFVLGLIAAAGAMMGAAMVTGSLAIAIAPTLPLPLFLEVIQRSAQWTRVRRLLAHVACALLYIVATGIVSTIGTLLIEQSPAMRDLERLKWGFLANIPSAILIYSTSVSIVRALQWYRASMATEAVRRQLESQQVSRTRLLLEKRYRPSTIVATLRRIDDALPPSPARAHALLHQLASYARQLLRGSTGTPVLQSDLRAMRSALALQGIATTVIIDRSAGTLRSDGGELAAAIEAAAIATRPEWITVSGTTHGEDDLATVTSAEGGATAFAEMLAQDPTAFRIDDVTVLFRLTRPPELPAETSPPPSHHAPRSLSVTLLLMVLGYCISAVLLDLREAPLGMPLPLSRVLSFLAWIPAALLIASQASRMTRRTLRWAVLGAAMTSVVTALLVTGVVQVALALLHLDLGDPVFRLYDAFYILTRNLLIAQALTTITFAHELAGVLFARNREAARLRDELALAESREIESRFHPHFLFNALTLIASLIDTDPAGAAAISRRLADLVERTTTSAGLERWTVREELELAAGYLAVQEQRFSDRLRIHTWTVSAAAADATLPRLVLQPLLENIFKHAVARRAGPTSIGLSVRKRGTKIAVTLWNDGHCPEGPVQFGRGLDFVRRRLRAAGGEMTIPAAASRFVVHLVTR